MVPPPIETLTPAPPGKVIPKLPDSGAMVAVHGVEVLTKMNVRMLPKWQSLNCQIALQACFGTLYARYKT